MSAVATGIISLGSAIAGAAGGMWELPKTANTLLNRFTYGLVVTTAVVILTSLEIHAANETLNKSVRWIMISYEKPVPVMIYNIVLCLGFISFVLTIGIPIVSKVKTPALIHFLSIAFCVFCLWSIWHAVTIATV